MWHYVVDLLHARLVVEVFLIAAGSAEMTQCVWTRLIVHTLIFYGASKLISY